MYFPFEVKILARYYGIAQYSIVEGSRIPCTVLYISLNNPEFALAVKPG